MSLERSGCGNRVAQFVNLSLNDTQGIKEIPAARGIPQGDLNQLHREVNDTLGDGEDMDVENISNVLRIPFDYEELMQESSDNVDYDDEGFAVTEQPVHTTIQMVETIVSNQKPETDEISHNNYMSLTAIDGMDKMTVAEEPTSISDVNFKINMISVKSNENGMDIVNSDKVTECCKFYDQHSLARDIGCKVKIRKLTKEDIQLWKPLPVPLENVTLLEPKIKKQR